ncbi:hypothetical protein [Candidatus Palauibacter sp.]|uniref:hypothetical protein n=1 Tax=Candidatus Palauibacter sp. TaxID=3101350 RepID=UPI003B016DE8
MIEVLADSSHDAALITETVGRAARVVKDEGQFANGDTHAACFIVGCRQPIPSARLELLRGIERNAPWVPVILVTDCEPDVACRLCDIRVSGIVWFDDLSTELQSRIDAACRSTQLLRLADEIQSSALPPALRSALACSLRSATSLPVRGVKELAVIACYSPVTLSQEYRESVGGAATLSQFLNALTVMRAHQLRFSGLGWEAIAERLGLTRQTLYRKAKRWPGSTLAQLERTEHAPLLARFISDLARPLLNTR